MEKKVDNKKRILNVMIWVVVIAALMLTMHLLVNNFHLFEFLKRIHGG